METSYRRSTLHPRGNGRPEAATRVSMGSVDENMKGYDVHDIYRGIVCLTLGSIVSMGLGRSMEGYGVGVCLWIFSYILDI